MVQPFSLLFYSCHTHSPNIAPIRSNQEVSINSRIVFFSLSQDGNLLSIASNKGKLDHQIYNTHVGSLLQEENKPDLNRSKRRARRKLLNFRLGWMLIFREKLQRW